MTSSTAKRTLGSDAYLSPTAIAGGSKGIGAAAVVNYSSSKYGADRVVTGGMLFLDEMGEV